MHEMGIAVELVAALERLADEHHLARIQSVTVRAGALRGIVPEAMEMAFAAAAADSRAAGAALTLEIEAAEALCRHCGRRFRPDPDCYLCEACGLADVELTAGNDILLSSVTGEQVEEGATPR